MTVLIPQATALIISVGVTQPGITSTPCSTQNLTTSSQNPGETINCAPARTASRHCSMVVTEPAPTTISGSASAAICRIAPRATGVRRVTSATGIPPSFIALISGVASFSFSITTTGITPTCSRMSITLLIVTPSTHSQYIGIPSPEVRQSHSAQRAIPF